MTELRRVDLNFPLNATEDAVLVEEKNGYEAFNSYGELDTGGAVTNHIVWPLAGNPDLRVPASPGVQMSIVSTSTADDIAGTGIRTLHMHYLDASLNAQDEEIELDGTNPVTSIATDVRFIQCMHIGEFGTGKEAAGNISASNGGVTYSYLKAGNRRCLSSAKRVPAGKILMIAQMYAGSASGAADAIATVKLVLTAIGLHDYTEDEITIPQAGISVQDGSESLNLKPPLAVPEGLVVAFETTTDKAALVTAGFLGYLIDAP